MKSDRQMRAELRRVTRALAENPDDERTSAELYGIQQALSWALGLDAMPPVECASMGWLARS